MCFATRSKECEYGGVSRSVDWGRESHSAVGSGVQVTGERSMILLHAPLT